MYCKGCLIALLLLMCAGSAAAEDINPYNISDLSSHREFSDMFPNRKMLSDPIYDPEPFTELLKNHMN